LTKGNGDGFNGLICRGIQSEICQIDVLVKKREGQAYIRSKVKTDIDVIFLARIKDEYPNKAAKRFAVNKSYDV